VAEAVAAATAVVNTVVAVLVVDIVYKQQELHVN